MTDEQIRELIFDMFCYYYVRMKNILKLKNENMNVEDEHKSMLDLTINLFEKIDENKVVESKFKSKNILEYHIDCIAESVANFHDPSPDECLEIVKAEISNSINQKVKERQKNV